MAHPTVAAQLVRMLRDAGARRIYGVVGDSLNPVVDAVRHTDGIEWVHVSNEEGGAFAAAAEAQVTGQLAVCAGSCACRSFLPRPRQQLWSGSSSTTSHPML